MQRGESSRLCPPGEDGSDDNANADEGQKTTHKETPVPGTTGGGAPQGVSEQETAAEGGSDADKSGGKRPHPGAEESTQHPSDVHQTPPPPESSPKKKKAKTKHIEETDQKEAGEGTSTSIVGAGAPQPDVPVTSPAAPRFSATFASLSSASTAEHGVRAHKVKLSVLRHLLYEVMKYVEKSVASGTEASKSELWFLMQASQAANSQLSAIRGMCQQQQDTLQPEILVEMMGAFDECEQAILKATGMILDLQAAEVSSAVLQPGQPTHPVMDRLLVLLLAARGLQLVIANFLESPSPENCAKLKKAVVMAHNLVASCVKLRAEMILPLHTTAKQALDAGIKSVVEKQDLAKAILQQQVMLLSKTKASLTGKQAVPSTTVTTPTPPSASPPAPSKPPTMPSAQEGATGHSHDPKVSKAKQLVEKMHKLEDAIRSMLAAFGTSPKSVAQAAMSAAVLEAQAAVENAERAILEGTVPPESLNTIMLAVSSLTDAIHEGLEKVSSGS
ncbi:hypothetical protein cyc_04391 [Cyclospora cayetanensis]|uniref:Uncharacterized protein n=1 Tax=Cyclospora cayetanensis TaxID=88456 RepID=A0A1D3CSJ8_9EIME|nr:hypothetical protein cyc_04391 [Cyclospora cayetanensis]